MKNCRLLAVLVAALTVQIAALVFFIWRYERVMRNGTEIRVKCQGFDPYDPFRGRYLQISARETCTNFLFGTESIRDMCGKSVNIFAKFEEIPGGNSFYRFEAVATNMQPDGIWIKPASAKIYRQTNDTYAATIDLPDTLYINERLAAKADRILRKRISSAAAVYMVLDGKIILKDIEIDGTPICELASESAP